MRRVAEAAAVLWLVSTPSAAFTAETSKGVGESGQKSTPPTDATLTGFVFAPDARPITAAIVLVSGEQLAETNEDGAFTIAVRTGTRAVEIRAPGRADIEAPIVISPGATIHLIVVFRSDGSATVDVETTTAEPPRASMGARGARGARSPTASTSTSASTLRLETVSEPEAAVTGTTSIAGNGVVEGRVIDAEKRTPVRNARIFARGVGVDATTDENGHFSLVVPAGRIDLAVIHADFSAETVPGVVVPVGGRTPSLEVALSPVSVALADMVVTIPKVEGGTVFVLKERRESMNVSDVVGADQISKAGDSDAAGALRRVTGITVVGGRYVYVRGLGERYSSTLLDGSTLPSPDPERRVVPLDLFPASAIGSILVQKTFSPEYPGEFGGGTVNIRTREMPERFVASVGVSSGLRTGTTFLDGPSQPGRTLDLLGLGAGPRRFSDEVAAAVERARITPRSVTGQGFSAEELERLGESLFLDYGLREAIVPPDLGVSLDLGGPFTLFGEKAGALLGLTYDQGWFVKRTDRKTLLPDLSIRTDQDLVETQNTVSLGALLGLHLEMGKNHELRGTTFLSRISEKNSRTGTGFLAENPVDSFRAQYVEQMMVTQQVRGHHFPSGSDGPEIDWRYMLSFATRDEPDLRSIYYVNDEEGLRIDTNDNKNQRYSSELDDMNHDLGLDLSYPFDLFGAEETRLKAGAALMFKRRSVDTRRFTYAGGLATPFDQLPPERIFNPETIGPAEGQVELDETTLDNDSYSAKQALVGGYALGDVGLTGALRIMAGARFEVSSQDVETYLPPANRRLQEPNARADLTTWDLLPSATLSWTLYEDMVLRFAVSRTLARPNFRELSPAIFRDPAGSVEYQGNPDLERTLITNGDVRWEWYPSPGETFSVAGFVKAFRDPVEIRRLAGASDRETPENVPSASNLGAEVEFRKDLSFVAEALRDLYAAGNLTFVYSRVSLEALSPEARGVLTTLERPLQGQSPYVVNLQLGYDNVDDGWSIVALYNVFGRRISALGTRGVPDVYEAPVHRVDLVASKRFGRIKLGLKVKNLIDPVIEEVQGNVVVESHRLGRSLSVGLDVDLD